MRWYNGVNLGVSAVTDSRMKMQQPLRDKIAEDVKEFLARGGKIEQLAQGEQSAEGVRRLSGQLYATAGKKGKMQSMK